MLQADSAFLPKKFNSLSSKNKDIESLSRCRFRRNVLDRLILALADQQLVTGFALMLTGWIVYYNRFHSAHFTLIIYLSCLSSSSHLAALVTLRRYSRENPTLALFRIAIISTFAILLSISIALSDKTFGSFYVLVTFLRDVLGIQINQGALAFFSTWPIIGTFWTGVWQILPETRKRFQAWLKRVIWPLCSWAGFRQCSRLMKRSLSPNMDARLRRMFWASLEYAFFLGPCTVFLLQIAFALLGFALVLDRKFYPGGGNDQGAITCSLNRKDENEMGYGQILALLMLTLPVISTVEAYKGR